MLTPMELQENRSKQDLDMAPHIGDSKDESLQYYKFKQVSVYRIFAHKCHPDYVCA